MRCYRVCHSSLRLPYRSRHSLDGADSAVHKLSISYHYSQLAITRDAGHAQLLSAPLVLAYGMNVSWLLLSPCCVSPSLEGLAIYSSDCSIPAVIVIRYKCFRKASILISLAIKSLPFSDQKYI